MNDHTKSGAVPAAIATESNLMAGKRGLILGVANKRKRAGWSRDYLLTVLMGARN